MDKDRVAACTPGTDEQLKAEGIMEMGRGRHLSGGSSLRIDNVNIFRGILRAG